MQSDWFIDFMTLAATRSFTRAALVRHVTQPAFSRRIRALETWAQVDLIHRHEQPLTLTAAGRALLTVAPQLVENIRQAHALMRTHQEANPLTTLRLIAPPTLGAHFFPPWIEDIRDALGGLSLELSTGHALEACEKLARGECDLLLAYAHSEVPFKAEPERYEVLRVARERLLPCTVPSGAGVPLHALPGTAVQPVTYLACSRKTDLGQLIAQGLEQHPETLHLKRFIETDSCTSLLAMVMAGHGMAFLPERSVQSELASRRLVTAGPPLPLQIDICLVRVRPSESHTPAAALDSFWRRVSRDASPRATSSGCAPALDAGPEAVWPPEAVPA